MASTIQVDPIETNEVLDNSGSEPVLEKKEVLFKGKKKIAIVKRKRKTPTPAEKLAKESKLSYKPPTEPARIYVGGMLTVEIGIHPETGLQCVKVSQWDNAIFIYLEVVSDLIGVITWYALAQHGVRSSPRHLVSNE